MIGLFSRVALFTHLRNNINQRRRRKFKILNEKDTRTKTIYSYLNITFSVLGIHETEQGHLSRITTREQKRNKIDRALADIVDFAGGTNSTRSGVYARCLSCFFGPNRAASSRRLQREPSDQRKAQQTSNDSVGQAKPLFRPASFYFFLPTLRIALLALVARSTVPSFNICPLIINSKSSKCRAFISQSSSYHGERYLRPPVDEGAASFVEGRDDDEPAHRRRPERDEYSRT